METNTLIRKKTSARDFIKKFVLKYTKDNWEKLNAQNNGVDKNILKDIKKDEICLDWILGEVLMHGDFKELGFTLQADWKEDDKVHETIYRIKKKYIRQIFKQGEYQVKPFLFEFVKPVKKKIVVYQYETIPQ